MEKGKLNIRRKDKKIILNLTKENGKNLPVSDSSLTKVEYWKDFQDGDHDVSYVLEGGTKITEIQIGEKTIKPQHVQAPQQANQRPYDYQNNQHQQGNTASVDSALAPYNFIPLNDEVIKIEADDIPAFNDYKGCDGFIDLEITAQSPIYIRRNLSPDELRTAEQLGHNNNSTEALQFKDSLSGFNRPMGTDYRIPGSSLRGMIRTLYEVATYSKMTMLDDHRLYFRAFADSSIELRDQYSSKMIDSVGRAYRPKVSAGYLRKVGTKFEITEASTHHRVEESMVIAKGIIPHSMRTGPAGHYRANPAYKSYIERNPFIEVSYTAGPETTQHHSVEMYYSKVTDIIPASVPTPAGYQRGWLVLSGWIPGQREGKHMHWIISEPGLAKHPVPDDLIRDYEKDTNRKGTDVLKRARIGSTPCFYIMEQNRIKAFGHTGLFRMVYDNSIGDLRPQTHKTTDLDMTEAVFGKITGKDIRPGRVFFEDAKCTEPVETEVAQYSRILSGPKPSTFQHYLQQDRNQIAMNGNKPVGLKNYNSAGARLAGHKFYWHRNHNSWIAPPQEVENHRTQYTKIQPLDTGSVFKGRIRFMNLSQEELGAMLFVLNLPDGCCHKLGMAKPLGLGSVRINAKLSIIDRRIRYSDLLALGINENAGKDQVKAFTDLLRTKLKLGPEDVWNSVRLKELKRMLDFSNKPVPELTRYLEIEHYTPDNRRINEYKFRPILKKPSQIH